MEHLVDTCSQPRLIKEMWSAVDQTENPNFFTRQLHADTRNSPVGRQRYKWLLDLLQVNSGQQILDIGCGLGDLAQTLAQFAGPSGQVIGVDYSTSLIAEARRQNEGHHSSLDFRVADAHQLPFPDNIFDRCCSLGLFECVKNPQSALAEIVRVTKPGARVLLGCHDFGTQIVDVTDRATTRSLFTYYCDHEVNGWIGRQLPGLCDELGLVDISIVPHTDVIRDFDFFQRVVTGLGWLNRAQAANIVSAAELNGWLAELKDRQAKGRFLYCVTYFTVVGNKISQ